MNRPSPFRAGRPAVLLAAAGESLQLLGLQPYGTFRLEFVTDTATAVTGPLPT